MISAVLAVTNSAVCMVIKIRQIVLESHRFHIKRFDFRRRMNPSQAGEKPIDIAPLESDARLIQIQQIFIGAQIFQRFNPVDIVHRESYAESPMSPSAQ